MKSDFAFLFPPPAAVRFHGGSLDIRSLSFPLEVLKQFDFLFALFAVPNRGCGLEIIFQENPGLGGDGYAIDCEAGRIVLKAASGRGRFYALSTLLQVLAFHAGGGRMPTFSLRDAPAIPFRGFMFDAGPGGALHASGLRRLLLELALLKFSHFAVPPDAVGPGVRQELTVLARKTGLELILLDARPDAVSIFGPGPAYDGDLPVAPPSGSTGAEAKLPAGDWFIFFLDRCRQARCQGNKAVMWGDLFLDHPDWIRKAPKDILVLNRPSATTRCDFAGDAIAPFRRHHIPQALCPSLCGRDRILPDARSGMARVQSAFAAARAEKLAGVMLRGGAGEDGGCLPEGAALLHFQSGCLLWSGRVPGPASFSRWALGRDEPDLFRVYSFLAQAEHRLPFTHLRYLFEEPLLAPCSRQGDPREVVAHFRKAALYLKKREIAAGELAGFVDFIRPLYAFIAAKVEFSMRLEALLGDKDGSQEVGRFAEQLAQECLELDGRYMEARGRHFGPGGAPGVQAGFAELRRSLQHLARLASAPAACAELVDELRGGASGDAPDPGAAGRSRRV